MMLQRALLSGFIGLSLGIVAATNALARDSCAAPCTKLPKNARAVEGDGFTLAAYPGNTLSATLAKGKKKTILYAEGVLTDGPYPPFTDRILALGINVNGLRMQPSDDVNNISTEVFSPRCQAIGDPPCTVVGHWWVDMDDPAYAELLGVPVTVTLIGGNYSGPGFQVVDMSLRVRLQKK